MSNIRVVVEKVLFDQNLGASVMLLKEEQGERRLPIWIGPPEALSIAMALEKVALARPMTHDLTLSLLKGVGATIDWVTVSDFDGGTYYATMHLDSRGEKVDIDARPSDAVALAVRSGSPIYLSEKVLKETIEIGAQTMKEIAHFEEDLLDGLPDNLFGKYKM